MPVDRDPGPCLALLASFLPHERRSSKPECGRNAAASGFTALQLFPLYCLVLSCLIHLGPPIPIPLLGLLFVSRTVHPLHSLAWDPCGCAMCIILSSCLTLPACQSASPASLPSLSSPCPVLYYTSTHLGTLCLQYVLCRVILQAAGTVLLESYHKSTLLT